MFQGFYDLASNMITQNRNLNVISTNMANVSTTGYKSDRLTQSTFKEEMIYRYDRYTKTPIGSVSRVNTADRRITSHAEGILRDTGRTLDFAIEGRGFFVVQTPNGQAYTRNGSFNLDGEGYLTLQGVGRVLGTNGPIRLTTDNVLLDGGNNIVSADTGEVFGELQVVDFADYNQLVKTSGGIFTGGAPQPLGAARIKQKYIEASNVDMAGEMVAMMSAERGLQDRKSVV